MPFPAYLLNFSFEKFPFFTLRILCWKEEGWNLLVISEKRPFSNTAQAEMHPDLKVLLLP